MNFNPQKRADIKVGMFVAIVQKRDQSSGETTEGEVKRLLTNAAFHPRGIKVKLDTGEVGRVVEVIEDVQDFEI